ncbi:MAG: hypothetical protein Q9191_007520 [Dirinaria sp. TL-2023a]
MAISWKDLPTEIRIQILECTHLVRRWDWTWCHLATDGANIVDGCLQIPEKNLDNFCPHNPGFGKCTCNAGYSIPFPAGLFRVSRQMQLEAREVFYSWNRFVLSGSFVKSASFLTRLSSPAAHLIRKVDLTLDWDQLWDLGTPGSRAFQEWKFLVRTMQNHLLLGELWLSIDASSLGHELIELNDDGDHDYSWLKRAYYQIFGPLRRLKGLKKFHVFLSWSIPYEVKAEKEVMGLDYDSAADGKIPWDLRDHSFPHCTIPEGSYKGQLSSSEVRTLHMIDQLSDWDT